MEALQTLTNALLALSRVEETAGTNDAAYRKQCRIILTSPAVQHALARARDAPVPQPVPAQKPRPARKRTTAPSPKA